MYVKSFKHFFKKPIAIFCKQLHNNSNASVTISNQTNLTLEHAVDTETKILKVAIIGMPNAGKSTFINNLINRKVCATSTKVHTTRKKSLAIYTEANSQIIFIDTPGIVNLQEHKRFNLEKSFLKDGKSSLSEADVIGVIHDISNIWTRERLDLKIIRKLEAYKHKPSFIVLNKVDILKTKRKLLDLTRTLTYNCIDGQPIPGVEKKKLVVDKDKKEIKGWPNFKEVFMVSALTGSGLEEVKKFLVSQAKPGEWQYPENVFSNETPETLVLNSVKSKLLDFLPQEIPYELKSEIEYFEIDKNGIRTVVLVHCPSERISKLVAGDSEGKLRQIMESIQQDLQNTFNNFVKIKIVLNYPKNK